MVAAVEGNQDHHLNAAFAHLSVDEQVLVRWATRLCMLGGFLVIFTYARLGMLPFLADNLGVARYFTASVSETYKRDEWIVNRGLDLLMYSVPIIFCFGFWNRKKKYQVLAVLGFVTLLLPLRRSMLISLACMFLIMNSIRTQVLAKKYVAAILLLVVAYGASQMLFLTGILGQDSFDMKVAAAGVGSALPEVRDLGWVMSLAHEDKYWGATLVQAFVPVPSFLSDFSQKNSLRNVTTSLIGLDNEETTGGLRLTLAGEGYLNFGYAGASILCGILGYALANLNRIFLRPPAGLYRVYLLAQIFTWLCFWVYLAGTQAAATIKIGLLNIAFLTFVSHRKASVTGNLPA
jgi:hypothetical protein